MNHGWARSCNVMCIISCVYILFIPWRSLARKWVGTWYGKSIDPRLTMSVICFDCSLSMNVIPAVLTVGKIPRPTQTPNFWNPWQRTYWVMYSDGSMEKIINVETVEKSRKLGQNSSRVPSATQLPELQLSFRRFNAGPMESHPWPLGASASVQLSNILRTAGSEAQRKLVQHGFRALELGMVPGNWDKIR